MRYLILGAGGQLGQEWCHRLREDGIPHQALTLADCDVTRPDEVADFLDLVRPETVVNCSAYTKVDRAESEPERAFLVNGMAVGRLASACADRKIRLIHYSTDYVFAGSREDAARFRDGYPEEHAPAPIGVYGASKADGERRFLQSGVDGLLIRVAWLCGRHGSNFVKTMLRLAGERPELRVVADQRGAPSFTDNVVANSLYLDNLGLGGIWHVASTGTATWHGLAEEALRLKGFATPVVPITTADYPTPALRPAFSKLSVRKLEELPGTQIEDWRVGLARMLGLN
jgi:dTDP-4-dehydrorhamnose reductase